LAPELLEESETGMPVKPSKHSDIYSFGGIMLLVITSEITFVNQLSCGALTEGLSQIDHIILSSLTNTGFSWRNAGQL